MKMFKKMAAFAAAGVLCMTALVGCGGGGDSFYTGKWVPVEMTSSGMTITADNAKDMLGMDLGDYMSFEFTDGGKFIATINGEEDDSSTWEAKGDDAVIKADGGEEKTAKKDGDNIVLEIEEGVSVKLEKK